jgi:hypothetical protein
VAMQFPPPSASAMRNGPKARPSKVDAWSPVN